MLGSMFSKVMEGLKKENVKEMRVKLMHEQTQVSVVSFSHL